MEKIDAMEGIDVAHDVVWLKDIFKVLESSFVDGLQVLVPHVYSAFVQRFLLESNVNSDPLAKKFILHGNEVQLLLVRMDVDESRFEGKWNVVNHMEVMHTREYQAVR